MRRRSSRIEDRRRKLMESKNINRQLRRSRRRRAEVSPTLSTCRSLLVARKAKRQKLEPKSSSSELKKMAAVSKHSPGKKNQPKQHRDTTMDIGAMSVNSIIGYLDNTNFGKECAYKEMALQLKKLSDRFNQKRTRFHFLTALRNTSCFEPCLEYLSGRDLVNLTSCSRDYNRIVRHFAKRKIKKIIGEPRGRTFRVVHYVKGKDVDVRKEKRSAEEALRNSYKKMKMQAIQRKLRQRGIKRRRGKKIDLIEKLIYHDSKEAMGNEIPTLQYLWERESFLPFYVDQWLDAKDTTNKWLEAQIKEVQGTSVAIHYKGWKKKYDEWLDLSKGSSDWNRVARPLSRFHEHPDVIPHHAKFRKWLTTGFLYNFSKVVIMAHDTTEKWVEASIIGYRNCGSNCAQVRVTYHGWDSKYNEWIDVDSYRLAPRLNFPPPEFPASSRFNSPPPQRVQADHPGAADIGMRRHVDPSAPVWHIPTRTAPGFE
mmetsp:Transcript_25885/g.41656  ORF Transcript_25885/g.41656 Transcript_25885/m.41656 type:complete len:482 (+) Transcript_25885:225-1670(+)